MFLKVKPRETLVFNLEKGSANHNDMVVELNKLELKLYGKSVPHAIYLRDSSVIPFNIVHEFDAGDHDHAPYLQMDGGTQVGECKHMHFDSPILVRINARIPPIGWAEGESGPICTQSVKEAMEREGFTGFIFTAVTVECAKQPPEPLWEIWSDSMMPPSCSSLVDDDGAPVIPGRYENGCTPAECESPPLYLYTPEAINLMTGIDAAVTHEDFGPKTKLCEMRRLLVSQRFRQWALKNKFKLDYVPVLVKEAQ